ncbi:ABC transporter ATP-binding protein [Azospira inquinata]|uniref:ABC transporter ATP-binding protein n=1 Tax=Azospira inquinata TaxID=2785627 RepID=A0A975SNR3_9RHOO|nr:ABC transporter ATP-binding protein [Azospira inquinata]QWT45467.1 ABC transporter ATP-binding protein [Azospira inquinata]QWT49205.1 ABC transporter ATP-binding protein [Azospira inquinata]
MRAPIPASSGLQAYRLHYAWRGTPVLRGVNLALAPGEVVSLLGANGAGKSTLLRLLLSLLSPLSGLVTLGDRPLASFRRRELARHIAYVPQVHVTPFPYRVEEVVLMGRLPANGLLGSTSGPEDRERAARVLERLGILALKDRAYTEISGGERQLTLIARALIQEAPILVLDEPVNGLDYGHQMSLLDHLQSLAAEGYAILKTTHHPEHALLASTRVVLLEEGRIAADGRPNEVVTPASIRRLYGVQVAVFHSPLGHTAFYPLSSESAPD